MIKNLKDANLKGKQVFVRADFNVPVVNGKITDDFRIKKSFQTIDYLRQNGAKIILSSHIGGGTDTLHPVYDYLKQKYDVVFIEDYFPNVPNLEAFFREGKIVLLENLRKYNEEKNNDDTFAKHLAGLADIYINEAFSASHREHASIVKIPKYIPGYTGFVFEEEVTELSKAFHPEHPFVFILGGAKFDTKLPLIRKFWNIADGVFIGGALANDFLKEKGLEVGKSLVSQKEYDLSPFLNEKLVLPIDVVVLGPGDGDTKFVEEVLPRDTIVDAGLETLAQFAAKIQGAKFILWNGPLGNYESGFKEGTLNLARLIAHSNANSIVGGGDTIASITGLGLSDKFSFISTGGGAMLEFLANETLPGIEALNN